LVQILEFDARLNVEPAGIVPTFRSLPEGVRVTVFPLEVVPVRSDMPPERPSTGWRVAGLPATAPLGAGRFEAERLCAGRV